MTVSQWADAKRKLSSEASSEPGQWDTDRAAYQREILDAVNSSEVSGVVVMSSAQVGKTELLLNIIGYHIDHDPSPILLLQPTVDMAQAFSKDRLAPMVRDTPAIKGKVSDSKSRDSGNTILHKSFPGGHITMAGANSPASLASRPIRILLADEVDRYPVSAGTEGDPFNLAKKRTTTFWNRKIVAVSTPTVAGASRIEALYEDSTMEQYHVSCPNCNFKQPLKWSNIVFESACHACESCGAEADQASWLSKNGVWVPRKESSVRGFHLNELVSPWRRWREIIDDFKQAKKSPETLKTFVNTSLGETWQEEGNGAPEPGSLYARREHYAADVPRGACVITAAADVQDDRIEIGYEAWGRNEENWKIGHDILRGDPSRPDIWRKLDEALSKTFKHEDGVDLRVSCAVVDSGGHYAQEVYKFVKPREVRRIYAIKGKSVAGGPVVGRPSKSNLGKINLFPVGTDTAKELIYARLAILEPGPGYAHFPVLPMFDEEYFAQLAAEHCVTRFVKGRSVRKWEKIRPRNEALDLAVYNLAALYILNPQFSAIYEKLENVKQKDSQVSETTAPKRTRRRNIKQKNWATDI